MSVPEWWLNLSGAFFVFFILLLIVLIVVGLMLVGTLKQLTRQINELGNRANTISNQVETLVSSVQTTTTHLSSQTQSIVGSVDVVSRALAGKAEMVGSVLLVATLVGKFLRARRARR